MYIHLNTSVHRRSIRKCSQEKNKIKIIIIIDGGVIDKQKKRIRELSVTMSNLRDFFVRKSEKSRINV